MATTFKVLDVSKAKFAVKFTNGEQSAVLMLIWDGKVNVAEWLSRVDPFPEPPDVPDTQGYIGLTGECALLPMSMPPTPPPAPSVQEPTPPAPQPPTA